MNFILTGSLAIDRIMDFPGRFKEHILPDKIHALNVSFNIEKLTEKKGGTAANIAYSLALLGEKPQIVAAAGNDFYSYKQHLIDLKLPVEGIEEFDHVPTASCYITTDIDNNQVTAFHMGAMACETHMQIADLESPAETVVVLSPGNKMDMLRYAQECRDHGVRFIFDPGQTLPFLEPAEITQIMDGAYMLVVNDYELSMIMERTGMTRESITQTVQVLVVTLGAQGAEITENSTTTVVHAISNLTVVDPTGAGDAFRAGLLKGMSLGVDWQQAGQLGATAASYVIEQYGTQEHSYVLQEFAQRYEHQYGSTCPVIVH